MKSTITSSLSMKRGAKKIRNLFSDRLPRKKVLVFEGYQLKFPEIEIIYRVADKRYISVVSVDMPLKELSALNYHDHHPLFFYLGLSFAASHFLISDFSSLHCESADLNAEEISLIEDQLLRSLAEFRYLNGLDPSRRVRVTSSGRTPLQPVHFPDPQEKALLLNGGGKDSCVSAELLKKVRLDFSWLNAHPNPIRDRVVESSGVNEAYTVNFSLSPDVNIDASYPWGLKPYLGVITAASLIVAYLKGFKYIVYGAEHSADNPNLVYKGVSVNHQSGKTTAFEAFTNTMCANSILNGVTNFSIARPFTDLRLAEMFSHFPQYNNSFLSCNDGMGRGKWCNSCHKCAFTYMALYPFIGRNVSREIFGEDLFEKTVIRKLILELTTPGSKPWECVGTLEECRLALHYCLIISPEMEFDAPPFRRDLERACLGLDLETSHHGSLVAFHLPHNIPKQFEGPLRKEATCMLEVTLSKNPGMFTNNCISPRPKSG